MNAKSSTEVAAQGSQGHQSAKAGVPLLRSYGTYVYAGPKEFFEVIPQGPTLQ